MREYRLSKLASADLAAIADYTIDCFGIEQASDYRKRLFELFETLAAYPRIGSDCSRFRHGTRRFVHESHVIYYRPAKSGILILRILGTAQDPGRHFAT